MIRVAVAGASGYTGGDLLKLLLNHPHVTVTHVTSVSSVGKTLDSVHPFLRGRMGLTLEPFDADRLAQATDVAFFALPHGTGSRQIAQYVKRGRRAVDLSADFRLKNVKTYETWYHTKHASPALLKEAVYGLPELYRQQIPLCRLVANPGCYATATILALTPFLREKVLVPGSLVVDAKSGVSGAGKKLDPMYLFCEASENFQAYAPVRHRHVPEIEQTLSDQAGRSVSLTFVPHLVPMTRGILVTAYGQLRRKMSVSALRTVLENTYAGERFIRIQPEGRWPQTRDVANTNYVDINVTVDETNRRMIVMVALDNLVKGAAGQAVQNMNLLFGFDESTALR